MGGGATDTAAWSEFVRRYGPRIYNWCRQWRLQEADAQDITQTVLLRVVRQMETFRYDPGRSFRAWLKTVTRTAWCDWLENYCRPGQGTGDSAVFDSLSSIQARDELLQQLEDEYDRELLEVATARVRLRIKPHTWEAFRLLAYEGLSGPETANKLDMRLGAVYVAKSKVQKLLQEEIRRFDSGQEN